MQSFDPGAIDSLGGRTAYLGIRFKQLHDEDLQVKWQFLEICIERWLLWRSILPFLICRISSPSELYLQGTLRVAIMYRATPQLQISVYRVMHLLRLSGDMYKSVPWGYSSWGSEARARDMPKSIILTLILSPSLTLSTSTIFSSLISLCSMRKLCMYFKADNTCTITLRITPSPTHLPFTKCNRSPPSHSSVTTQRFCASSQMSYNLTMLGWSSRHSIQNSFASNAFSQSVSDFLGIFFTARQAPVFSYFARKTDPNPPLPISLVSWQSEWMDWPLPFRNFLGSIVIILKEGRFTFTLRSTAHTGANTHNYYCWQFSYFSVRIVPLSSGRHLFSLVGGVCSVLICIFMIFFEAVMGRLNCHPILLDRCVCGSSFQIFYCMAAQLNYSDRVGLGWHTAPILQKNYKVDFYRVFRKQEIWPQERWGLMGSWDSHVIYDYRCVGGILGTNDGDSGQRRKMTESYNEKRRREIRRGKMGYRGEGLERMYLLKMRKIRLIGISMAHSYRIEHRAYITNQITYHSQNTPKNIHTPTTFPSPKAEPIHLDCAPQGQSPDAAAFFVNIIMFSGGIRRGLHIDDDDEAKPTYEYQGLQAERKRGNFEKDLDAMLFGGMGAPPPRRRPASEAKPTEQGKPADTPKPAETQKQQPPPVSVSVGKPVQPATIPVPSNNAPVVPPAKAPESKPVIKPTDSVTINVNKSTDSGKKVPTNTPPSNQTSNQTGLNNSTTITINSNAKVVVKEVKTVITQNKKEPSILVPAGENDKAPVINNIPIESQPVLPAKRADSPPAQKPTPKTEEKKPQAQQQPTYAPQAPQPSQAPAVPAQPKKQEQPQFLDILHPFSIKANHHKPSPLRKLKKVAEDYKFAEQNLSLTSSVDVVRPFQTDRSRQKKLNDFDFKDYEFPACSFSLGGQHKAKPSVWKRQNELAKTASFGKYIDPNDIHPGLFSSPHLASILSALSENQQNIKRLIQDQKANSNGFYLIRLFINSVWRYVVVDSALPFLEGENAGIVSAPDNEFQLAPSLIEKAYAKSLGGYDSLGKIQPREHYLRDLTGAPVKKYAIDNPDLNNIIKKALGSGQAVLAVPNEKIAALGLNPNFSYSVLNHSAAKGSLELRSSFGTLEEKTKLSIKAQGNFDLGGAQVKECISHILVSSLNTAYSTTTIQSRHRQGFYSSYSFTLRKNAHGFLTVSQWDQRLFPSHSGYEYSPFRVVLHRVQEDGHTSFINAAFTPGSRNLDLQVTLPAGNYTAFVSANWKYGEYAYNLTFHGSQRVDFQRVYTEKVPNLIGESLESINLQAGRRTDLNKNSCQYFHYHPESNLAILTVENTSDRAATVTADLSKVKFDHLLLLTSHNNEENYSNKLGAEIEEYKQIPLTDRRWSVSLQGGHRFTWVLATDQPYHPDNPKAWGFS